MTLDVEFIHDVFNMDELKAVILEHKEHLNETNKRNYKKRTLEGRNKALVGDRKQSGRKKKESISDDDIMKALKKKKIIKQLYPSSETLEPIQKLEAVI